MHPVRSSQFPDASALGITVFWVPHLAQTPVGLGASTASVAPHFWQKQIAIESGREQRDGIVLQPDPLLGQPATQPGTASHVAILRFGHQGQLGLANLDPYVGAELRQPADLVRMVVQVQGQFRAAAHGGADVGRTTHQRRSAGEPAAGVLDQCV